MFHSQDLRVDDINRVLALLDRRNGSDDGGILSMIQKTDAMNLKITEIEKELRDIKRIVKTG